jgi:cholesterol transport system auxiliary component
MTKRLAAALLALILTQGGCVSLGGAKVPPVLFTLTARTASPAGATASGTSAEAIVVVEPETDRRLAVQRVPVQVDDANVAYLQKAMWVERPSRLFQGLLAETIRAKGGRLVFESDGKQIRFAQQLSGRLIDMGYDARSQSVVVRFDALREVAGGVVTVRRFEAIERGVAAQPDSIGPALNRAANAVAAQVAEWVG